MQFTNQKITIAGHIVEHDVMEQPIKYGPTNRKKYAPTGKPLSSPEDNELSSANRTKAAVRRLVNSNAHKWKKENGTSYLPIFVTLTFEDDIRDLDTAHNFFKVAMQRLNYFVSGGYKVHKSVLHRTLTNPVHCGFVIREGKYFVGTHTPIVGQELFDNVQAIINGKNKSRKQTHYFPHHGYMHCHVCGCALTGTLKKGHTYYYCTNGKDNCEQHKKYLRSESVDNIVGNIFGGIEFDE